MCLIINDPNPQISKENIVCYKLLKIENVVDSEDGRLIYKRYVTPYRYFEPRFYEVLTAEGQLIVKPHHSEYMFYINEGAFHSFETFEDADEEAPRLLCESGSCVDGVAVVKCIIPAGTLYYRGYFCGYTSYASKEIIFSEIIIETTSRN